MAGGQLPGHALQVIKAAEKRQVIAVLLLELGCDQLNNRRYGGVAMRKTRRDLADDPN